MVSNRDLKADAVVVAEALVEMDILKEEGLHKLANLFRGIRAFSEVRPTSKPKNPSRNGLQETQPENHEPAPEIPNSAGASTSEQAPNFLDSMRKPQPAAPNRGLEISRLDLQNLHDVMTVKQIAQLKGVSAMTVNRKLKVYGIA